MKLVIGGILTALICAAVGAAAGFASYNGFYLIVLFPIIMAFVAGTGIGFFARGTNSPALLLVLMALVCGLIAYGSYRITEYLLVVREVGSSVGLSFIDFLDFSADLGTTISRGSSEITLDRNATIIYWIVEIVVVVIFSMAIALRNRNTPPKPATPARM